jgi:hypothetical protein
VYQPASYHRRDSLISHPPYGLYLDPHRGQHNWTAASTRMLLVIVVALGSFLLVVALGPH